MAAGLLVSTAMYGLEVTPGALKALLGNSYATTTELTLTGSANAADLVCLSGMPMLQKLDISGLKIETLSSDTVVTNGRKQFPANTIPSFLFACSRLQQVSLPATLQMIEECAFAGSHDLVQVTLGNALTSLGDWTFYDCTALREITLPATLASMGEGVFAHCVSLASAQLDASAMTELPARTFAGCEGLKSVKFPKGVTGIGDECFMGSGLVEVTIPSISLMGDYAFSQMPALEHATVGSGTVTGKGMFYNCPVLTTAEGLTEVPALALAGCGALQVDSTWTSNLVALGDYALADHSYDHIWLSKDLQSVGQNVFDGMNNLHSIRAVDLMGNIPDTPNHAFDGLPNEKLVNLWVHEGHEYSWTQHPQWSRFTIIPTTTGVEQTVIDEGGNVIRCVKEGDNLVISATEILSAVNIYDLTGRIIAAISPGMETLMFDLADIDAPVLLVKASTRGKTQTFKIAIR